MLGMDIGVYLEQIQTHAYDEMSFKGRTMHTLSDGKAQAMEIIRSDHDKDYLELKDTKTGKVSTWHREGNQVWITVSLGDLRIGQVTHSSAKAYFTKAP